MADDKILKTPPLNEINDICDDDCTYKGLKRVAERIIELASAIVPLKLYHTLGTNTDGAIDQNTVTKELEDRLDKVYLEGGETGETPVRADGDVPFSFEYHTLVPKKGLTGQALVKRSNSDYDTEWADVGGGGGTEHGIPAGGTTGQYLVKTDDSDYNVEWVDDKMPKGGTTGQVLKKVSDDNFDIEWGDDSTPSNYLESIEKDTTNEEITITDNEGNETTFSYGGSGSTAYPLTKTSETTITINPNNTTWITGTPSSVNLTLGTPLEDYESEYRLTFVAGESASLTVNAPTGYTVVYPDNVPTFESGKLYEFSFMAINPSTISCLWKAVVGGVAPVMNISGKIFHIDPEDNGATYKFFDANGIELTTQTVEGLATAVSYAIEGTPTKDKFYILATDPDNDNHAVIKTGGVQWGAYGTLVGITADGTGQGKSNTATALANPDCFNDNDGGTNTIWTWIKAQRDNNLNGYNGWFIPSVSELQKLYESGIERTYIHDTVRGTKTYGLLRSSVELNNLFAYHVHWDDGASGNNHKNDGSMIDRVWGCVAVRSI